jgi:hypothetical protein
MSNAGDRTLEETAAADQPPPEGPAPDMPRFKDWLAGAALPREAHLLLGLVAPALVLLANMWRVRSFTIDDAYISYRYARNLANGHGLVYNAGERIEGYTNFLWTVLLAGGIKVGIDPDVLAKALGALFAVGTLGVTYQIAGRFQPFGALPCVATWLLATTIASSGYAVFGLETSMFGFLVLAGIELMFREEEALGASATPADVPWHRRLPLSGLVFATATLTRMEALAFMGIPMLFLGLRFFSVRNIVRGGTVVAIVGAHMLWRHAYYGGWWPATADAKTGNLTAQVPAGWGYIQNYFTHAGPLLWLAVLGVALGVVARRRDMLAVSAIAAFWLGYVVVVGGDWMPLFRFMAPFEPLCFLLVDAGARWVIARKRPAATIALLLFGGVMVAYRIDKVRDAQRTIIQKEERFWRMAAGGTARWFKEHGERGEIAIGDIGYVGWATDYPILDLLGLVDPVISKLPGGYTRKLGPGFNERFFDKAPKYFLLISANLECTKPSVPGSQVIYADKRFKPHYEVAGRVPLDGGFAWCIYQRKPPP